MPQQWLAHSTAPGVASDDRRRLDLVMYEATPLRGAICCDATPLLEMVPRCNGKASQAIHLPRARWGGLSPSACSGVKLVDAGTPQPYRLCGAWSRSVPAGPHRPCAAPPAQLERDAGGACSPRQCLCPGRRKVGCQPWTRCWHSRLPTPSASFRCADLPALTWDRGVRADFCKTTVERKGPQKKCRVIRSGGVGGSGRTAGCSCAGIVFVPGVTNQNCVKRNESLAS